MDIDFKMLIHQLNDATYFPAADDIYIDIFDQASKSETKAALAKLCKFFSPNTRTVSIGTRYHIEMKCIRNLIGNKWEIVDNN